MHGMSNELEDFVGKVRSFLDADKDLAEAKFGNTSGSGYWLSGRYDRVSEAGAAMEQSLNALIDARVVAVLAKLMEATMHGPKQNQECEP